MAEEMTAWLRAIDGFEGFLPAHAAGRHRAARMEFLEMTSVAGVEVEETLDFTVAFSELSARAAPARPD